MGLAQIFVSILFLCIGTFSLTAAIMNWNWFFESVNASIFLRWFGRKGARFFYAILGIIVIVISIMMMTGVMD